MPEMRPIPGFPGYHIDTDGVVWSEKRRGGGRSGELRALTPVVHRTKGYLFVRLYQDGRLHTKYIHRMVLQAFVGPRPPGMGACHYPDADKTNNKLTNLRWDTHAENMRDRCRHITPASSKVCRGCGTEKPASEYYACSRSADGLRGRCADCLRLEKRLAYRASRARQESHA